MEVKPAHEIIQEFTKVVKELKAKITKLSNDSVIATVGSGKRFAVMAGTHGDERSGPLALLEWIRKNHDLIKTGEFEFWFLPLLNVRGWNENKRNCGVVNPNREFYPGTSLEFLEGVMQSLRKKVPLCYLDLHEDVTTDHPYLWKHNESEFEVVDYIANKMQLKTYHWNWSQYGKDKVSSEEFVRKLGCKHTVTTEIYPREPLEDRIKFQMRSISLALEFCQGLKNI
jgi:predicted deacylase